MVAMVDRIGRRDGEDALSDLRADAVRSIMDVVAEHARQSDLVTLYAHGARQITVLAPRRGGKTAGIGMLCEALAIKHDGYTIRVLCQRLSAPSQNWLDAKGKESTVARLRRLGLAKHVKFGRQAGSVTSVLFDWGSAIYVHDVATQAAIDNKHGSTAHLWWADEAQSIALLHHALGELVYPTLSDHGGAVILSGTPGRDVGTLFFEACQPSGIWKQVRCPAWSNPHFGDTDAHRWAHIMTTYVTPARRAYGLSDDDLERLGALSEDERNALSEGRKTTPEIDEWVAKLRPVVRRQLLGMWVVGSAEDVYSWNFAPDGFYWAQVADSPWNLGLPIADSTFAGRVAQLPKLSRFNKLLDRHWYARIGCDLGWSKSSTAIVVCVWSTGLDVVYVVWSEAKIKEDDDGTFDRLADIAEQIRDAGLELLGVTADVTGMRLSTGATWDNRFRHRFGARVQAWVKPPNKSDKAHQMIVLDEQILAGRLRVLAGDELDIEGRFLRWKPQDPGANKPSEIDKFRMIELPNGQSLIPGDHCADALRYVAQDIPLLQQADENRRELDRNLPPLIAHRRREQLERMERSR